MIELRHLRYFVAVAEELNFRRAAERVHIDQTPLSRSIRDLEERLGLTLIVRGPRALKLTPAGDKLLGESNKIFIRIERALRAVRETDARYRAPLRIGIADGISQPKLSDCLVRWRHLAPEVPLELAELGPSDLAKALEREEIEAGFTFGLPDHRDIEHIQAWSYPLLAVLPASHELAAHASLRIADLLAFPLLSHHPARLPGLVQQLHAILRRHAIEPLTAGEADTLNGYLTRIAAGQAVGWADAGHIAPLCRTDIAAIPLDEGDHVTTFVVHKRQRLGLQGVLQRFLANAVEKH